MTDRDRERLPADLQEVADRLRAEKTEASPLELDEIKLRAMAQASRAGASRQRRGLVMRSKIVTLALCLGLVVSGGTAGVIAGGGNGNGADKSQYKPGKGCGDKNHVHEREDECKKPPK